MNQRTRWIVATGIILPIILFLLSVFLPVWLTAKKKNITLEIQTNRQLFAVEKRIQDRLEALDFKKLMNQLNLVTLRLINSGNVGILGATEVTKDIEINFPEHYRIIGNPEIIENPYDVGINFNKSSEENKIKLRFDLLNKNQYFTMDIFYIGGPPVTPSLKAKILNLDRTEVKNIAFSIEEERERLVNSVSTAYAGMFLILAWIIMFIYVINTKKLEPPQLQTYSISILVLIINGVIISFIFYIRFFKSIKRPINLATLTPLIWAVIYVGIFTLQHYFAQKKVFPEKTGLGLFKRKNKQKNNK